MKRIIIMLILVAGGAGLKANAQKGYTFLGADYNIINRQSTLLHNNYVQLDGDISFQPRWANFGGGLEMDVTDEELTRYFGEYRVKVNDNSSVVVRLNHLEYYKWKVGENYLNAYYTQKLKHLKWSLGLAWAAPIADDYNNPFKFETDFDQLRALYSVSYGFPFYKNKGEFRVGLENFTRFENYGYDEVGPFFEVGFQATDYLRVNAKADLRVIGIDTGTMSLERETFQVGLEYRNVAGKPKPAPEVNTPKPEKHKEKKSKKKKSEA